MGASFAVRGRADDRRSRRAVVLQLPIFETTRGDDHVRCEIEPGEEMLRLRWWHGRHERLALDLHWVRSLRVVTGGGRDYLIAAFRDEHLLDLEFHLKPIVCLRWGTSCSFPNEP